MFDRIGFRTSGLRHIPVETALDGIAEAGFHTVEFCLEHPGASLSSMDYAGKAGLEISSVSYHGKRDNPEVRMQNGRKAVRMAAEKSVPVVVFGSPLRDEDGCFHREASVLCAECVNLGISPAWETEPGTVLNGLEEFYRHIVPLDPCAGINLDAGHLHLQGRCTAGDIGKLSGRIHHVHVEGMDRAGHVHLVPGRGNLNWRELFSGLSMAGYSGSLTIDLFDLPAGWREYIKEANVALNSLIDYIILS